MKKKKIPLRVCAGCQEQKSKKEMIRVVRTPEGAVDPVIGEVRPDEVDLIGGLAQVDGKARLMLAAPGKRHILLREVRAALRQGVVPDPLLFRLAPPAGDRDDLRPAARLPDAGGQQLGGPPVQQDVRMAAVHGGEIDRTAGLEGVLPVHQHQGAGPALLPGKAYGPHASTPSSTSRLTRVWKSRPMACIIPG